MEEKIKKEEEKVVIREDGVLKAGVKLIVRPEYAASYSGIQRGLAYTVSGIREVYKLDMNGPMYYVSFAESLPNTEYPSSIFSIVPTNFNVYRWKGYYILATSEEQAQRIWDTYVDYLEIKAADGRPKLHKLVNNLKNRGDQELFPRIVKRVHSEYPFPCIVGDLDFEEEPVFTYKSLY